MIIAMRNLGSQAMAEALRQVQRSDGFWNASLHDPNNYSGMETNGTAFFTYRMAWGINNGLLDEATYSPVAERAWTAMATEAVHPSGFLGYVQGTGAEPSNNYPFTYNDTTDFGFGAFLLASIEVYMILTSNDITPTPTPGDTTTPTLTPDETSTPTPTPTPTSGPVDCSNVLEWDSGVVYENTGMLIVYNGYLYENNWYSSGKNPEENTGEHEVWALIGLCDGDITSTPTPVTNPGDVNSDGNITIVDALLVAQFYVELDPANFDQSNADTKKLLNKTSTACFINISILPDRVCPEGKLQAQSPEP